MSHSAASLTLSVAQRRQVLFVAFLAWLGAGGQMGVLALTMRPAYRTLAANLDASVRGSEIFWISAQLCAMQLGAVAGGILLGRFADRRGRVAALGLSVVGYSIFAGLVGWATSIEQVVGLRFLTGLGIGGTWPAAVALAGEAWSDAAKAKVAGVIGAAANVGIFLQASLSQWLSVGDATWRTAMFWSASPLALGILILYALPESPRWLAERAVAAGRNQAAPAATVSELFRGPLRRNTLLGICLASVPLLGAWGSGKWLFPWAGQEGVSASFTQAVWAVGAVLSSALGGKLAELCGRRQTYFFVSLATLVVNLSIYKGLQPTDRMFLPMVFLSGIFGTVFFGWLPLYLPELFPTRVRGTGIGLTYNAGRIASATGILIAGMSVNSSYAQLGAATSWVYAVGMLVILFAPAGDDAAPKTVGERESPLPAASKVT